MEREARTLGGGVQVLCWAALASLVAMFGGCPQKPDRAPVRAFGWVDLTVHGLPLPMGLGIPSNSTRRSLAPAPATGCRAAMLFRDVQGEWVGVTDHGLGKDPGLALKWQTCGFGGPAFVVLSRDVRWGDLWVLLRMVGSYEFERTRARGGLVPSDDMKNCVVIVTRGWNGPAYMMEGIGLRIWLSPHDRIAYGGSSLVLPLSLDDDCGGLLEAGRDANSPSVDPAIVITWTKARNATRAGKVCLAGQLVDAGFKFTDLVIPGYPAPQ